MKLRYLQRMDLERIIQLLEIETFEPREPLPLEKKIKEKRKKLGAPQIPWDGKAHIAGQIQTKS